MRNFSQKGNSAIANVAASVYKTTRRKADTSLQKARKMAIVAADKTKLAAWNSAERIASYSTAIAIRVGKTTTEVAVAFGDSVREVATAKAQTFKMLISMGAETAKNALIEKSHHITYGLNNCVKSYVGASTEMIMQRGAPFIAQVELFNT